MRPGKSNRLFNPSLFPVSGFRNSSPVRQFRQKLFSAVAETNQIAHPVLLSPRSREGVLPLRPGLRVRLSDQPYSQALPARSNPRSTTGHAPHEARRDASVLSSLRLPQRCSCEEFSRLLTESTAPASCCPTAFLGRGLILFAVSRPRPDCGTWTPLAMVPRRNCTSRSLGNFALSLEGLSAVDLCPAKP